MFCGCGRKKKKKRGGKKATDSDDDDAPYGSPIARPVGGAVDAANGAAPKRLTRSPLPSPGSMNAPEEQRRSRLSVYDLILTQEVQANELETSQAEEFGGVLKAQGLSLSRDELDEGRAKPPRTAATARDVSSDAPPLNGAGAKTPATDDVGGDAPPSGDVTDTAKAASAEEAEHADDARRRVRGERPARREVVPRVAREREHRGRDW